MAIQVRCNVVKKLKRERSICYIRPLRIDRYFIFIRKRRAEIILFPLLLLLLLLLPFLFLFYAFYILIMFVVKEAIV